LFDEKQCPLSIEKYSIKIICMLKYKSSPSILRTIMSMKLKVRKEKKKEQ